MTTRFGRLVSGVGLAASLAAGVWAGAINPANAEWIVTQRASGAQFDTRSELITIKGVSDRGLMSVGRRNGVETIKRWEEGAFGASVLIDGTRMVDGRSLENVSRMTGFKTDGAGGYVYLRTPKGPKARVQLYLNDTQVHDWPRLSIVRILAFRDDQLTVSVFDRDKQQTQFWRYRASHDPSRIVGARMLGAIEDCAVLKAKPRKDDMLLQLQCNADNGSDLYLLESDTGTLTQIHTGPADALLAEGLIARDILKTMRPAHMNKDAVPTILVGGNANGRSLLHAINGVLLRDLGEPMSLASDGAGKQSWSQSYRTRVLASLHKSTGHDVFARLARIAMRRTLRQRNERLDVTGPNNPGCGWASRIYSMDKQTPISLLINQAMISGSLLSSCRMLGDACTKQLADSIAANAQCLVAEYEKDFDNKAGLYRIPYGAPFRYDGLQAPWNWQMMWSGVLAQSPDQTGQLQQRATSLVSMFTDTWSRDTNGALWHYWPAQFHQGWQAADRVSLNRPNQKAALPKRYEDLNHAGISLLGMADASDGALRLSDERLRDIRRRLGFLLAYGHVMPRDLDGAGPRSPRWMPGAGWDGSPTDAFAGRYATYLPGAHSSDQHLAYASSYDPTADFEVSLTLIFCDPTGCEPVHDWAYASAKALLADNPLFELRRSTATTQLGGL